MSHKVIEIVLSASRTFAYPNRSLSTTAALRIEPSGDLGAVESIAEAQERAETLVDEHKAEMARYLDEAEQNEKARMLVPALERDVEHARSQILGLVQEMEELRMQLEEAKDLVPCRCGHTREQHDYDDKGRGDEMPRYEVVCEVEGCPCEKLTYPWERR